MIKKNLSLKKAQTSQEEIILVDLDGTLAFYDHWRGKEHIGEPIPEMLNRVKQMISEGKTIRIFTARAEHDDYIPFIRTWLEKYGLGGLAITNQKDMNCTEIYDDKAVQIITNTGKRIDGKE